MLGVASSLFTLGVILVTSAFSLYLLLRGARSLGYIFFYPSFPAWLSCQPAFSLPHSSPPRCSWSFASLFYLLCLPGGAVLLLVLLACCFVCSCRFSCCGARRCRVALDSMLAQGGVPVVPVSGFWFPVRAGVQSGEGVVRCERGVGLQFMGGTHMLSCRVNPINV